MSARQKVLHAGHFAEPSDTVDREGTIGDIYMSHSQLKFMNPLNLANVLSGSRYVPLDFFQGKSNSKS